MYHTKCLLRVWQFGQHAELASPTCQDSLLHKLLHQIFTVTIDVGGLFLRIEDWIGIPRRLYRDQAYLPEVRVTVSAALSEPWNHWLDLCQWNWAQQSLWQRRINTRPTPFGVWSETLHAIWASVYLTAPQTHKKEQTAEIKQYNLESSIQIRFLMPLEKRSQTNTFSVSEMGVGLSNVWNVSLEVG